MRKLSEYCSYGHKMTADNVYYVKSGRRYCRTCNKRNCAEYRSKRKSK